MAVRKLKPTTPGQRHKIIGAFETITASAPEKSLVFGLRKSGGRNNTGKMTMKLIQTLKNIWKIEELRDRLLITLGFVAVYRLCSFVIIPGIDASALTSLHSQTREGLMSLLDMFSGGAFSNASIVALGIMPYISASIVMQLLGMAFPYFQKLQREGESGRMKMNQYTRYLTVLILLLQAPAYLANLSVQMGYAGSALPSGAWARSGSSRVWSGRPVRAAPRSGPFRHG